MPKQCQQQNDGKWNSQDPQQSASTKSHLTLLKLRHDFVVCRADNATFGEGFHWRALREKHCWATSQECAYCSRRALPDTNRATRLSA